MWVKTMVRTRPMRFDMEDATRFDADDMILVTKNRVPRSPSASLNLRLKKYVIQDAGTVPQGKSRIRGNQHGSTYQGQKPYCRQRKVGKASPVPNETLGRFEEDNS